MDQERCIIHVQLDYIYAIKYKFQVTDKICSCIIHNVLVVQNLFFPKFPSLSWIWTRPKVPKLIILRNQYYMVYYFSLRITERRTDKKLVLKLPASTANSCI